MSKELVEDEKKTNKALKGTTGVKLWILDVSMIKYQY